MNIGTKNGIGPEEGDDMVEIHLNPIIQILHKHKDKLKKTPKKRKKK